MQICCLVAPRNKNFLIRDKKPPRVLRSGCSTASVLLDSLSGTERSFQKESRVHRCTETKNNKVGGSSSSPRLPNQNIFRFRNVFRHKAQNPISTQRVEKIIRASRIIVYDKGHNTSGNCG